jgi:hypothetical protein
VPSRRWIVPIRSCRMPAPAIVGVPVVVSGGHAAVQAS